MYDLNLPQNLKHNSGVVLLWAGGGQYFAQTIAKVGFGPPQYLRRKGANMILEAWAPQCQKCDYTPCINITLLLTTSKSAPILWVQGRPYY